METSYPEKETNKTLQLACKLLEVVLSKGQTTRKRGKCESLHSAKGAPY